MNAKQVWMTQKRQILTKFSAVETKDVGVKPQESGSFSEAGPEPRPLPEGLS